MRIIPFILATVFVAGAFRGLLPELLPACGPEFIVSDGCVVVCETSCSGSLKEGLENDHGNEEDFPPNPSENCCLPMICCSCCCYCEQIQFFTLFPPTLSAHHPVYREGLFPRKDDCEVFHPPEVVFT